MADQQNRQHDKNPHDDIGAVGHESFGQRIEHQRQHAARQADGEKPDVRQHVAEQPRQIVVEIPHARPEVEQRIAPGRVEEQHQHGADSQHDIERHRRGGETGNDPWW